MGLEPAGTEEDLLPRGVPTGAKSCCHPGSCSFTAHCALQAPSLLPDSTPTSQTLPTPHSHQRPHHLPFERPCLVLSRVLKGLGQSQDPSKECTVSRAQDAAKTWVIGLWERTPCVPYRMMQWPCWVTKLQLFEGLWVTQLQRTKGVRSQLGVCGLGKD